MRGNPLFRACCFILAWLCLFPVVHALTSFTEQPPQDAATPPAAEGTVPAWAHLRFAHVPEQVRVAAGSTVWVEEKSPMDTEISTEFNFPLSSSTVVLDIQGIWANLDNPTMIELTVEPEGLPSKTIHLWTETPCRRKVRLSW